MTIDFTVYGFSEESSIVANGLLDFTRCVRPDGTAYGTRGKCRKGAEKEKEQQVSIAPEPKVEQKRIKSKTNNQDPNIEYSKLLKKQQNLVSQGDIAGAMKLQPEVNEALKRVESTKEAASSATKLKTEAERKQELKEKIDRIKDRQLKAGLRAKEKEVIVKYTEEALEEDPKYYRNVNSCLRRMEPCNNPEKVESFSKKLDKVLNKLPDNIEGVPFYRGVKIDSYGTRKLYESLKNAKPGTEIQDSGYGSYSYNEGIAKSFANASSKQKAIVFVSTNKSLTPINMFSEYELEGEAILPRGTKQTISSVTEKDNILYIELN